MYKGEERRRQIRVFLPGGQVRLVSGPFQPLVGRVIDISVGGIKFVCEADLVTGDTISLDILIPGGHKFVCTAKIIHAERSRESDNLIMYGAQFIDLQPQEKAALGEHILSMRAAQDGFLKDKLDQ